jgi:hypothetical protein
MMMSSPFSPRALAASQPPIGYERWTHTNADAGVDFGLTAGQVFQKYAAQFFLGTPAEHMQKDKRLIDIEVRPASGGLADYVYDVIWVKNEGALKLESWFVPGLTADELHQLPQLASGGIVVLDVERYPQEKEWRYSVILQRNAGKFGFDILTNASWDTIEQAKNRNGLRVLDLDYALETSVASCPSPSLPSGQACAPSKFDAILVANTGSNQITTAVHFNMAEAQIIDKATQGYQIIDHEGLSLGKATVWVKPGEPFNLIPGLSENEVTFENNHHGRVVDLEQPADTSTILQLP